MKINDLTNGIVKKIVALYPNINVVDLKKKLSQLTIIESEVGERTPFVFEQNNNVLKLNFNELSTGKYDLEYYMTIVSLLLTKEYDASLQGIRTGYFAGIASNLVGNFVSETENEIEPGIDIYESLRSCVVDLNNKVGADNAVELCESNNLEEFIAIAKNIGLRKPQQFLDPYNYLAINSANLTENQINGIIFDIDNSIGEIELELSNFKTI